MKMSIPHKNYAAKANPARSLTGKIALAGLLGMVGMTPSVMAATGTWNKDGGAATTYNWSDIANWTENAAPNGIGAVADLSTVNLAASVAAGTTTIKLNGDVTVGTLLLGDTAFTSSTSKGAYTIAAGTPAGKLIFNSGSTTENAKLTHVSTAGALDTISSAVSLGSNLDVTNLANNVQLKVTGTVSLNGNTLTASAVGGNNSFAPTTFGSVIGSGAFVVNGSGYTSISGASSNTFSITVNSGGLSLTTASIGTVGDITTTGTGTVVGFVSGIATYSKSISGTGRFVKDAGTGTLTMTGANTYTGTTTVTAGDLRVNGSLGQTAVTVAAAGTLSGKGSIGGTVAVSGTLSAGDAGIGTLQTAGLTLNATSVFNVEISGEGATAASDRVDVTGGVNIASGALLKLTIAGLAPAGGDVFYLVTNDASDDVVGNFKFNSDLGLVTLTEGSQFTWNSQDWVITYRADATTSSFTDGNDIAIRAVPEPSTCALLVGGLGMLVVAQGMRKRSMAS